MILRQLVIFQILDFLIDENGKNFENLYANNFDEVITWLK